MLESYLDGTLPEQEKRFLETRLQTDRALKAHLDHMRNIERAAADALSITAPEALTASVMQSIHEEALNKQSKFGINALSMYFFIISALGVAAFFIPPTSGQRLSFLDPAIEWLSRHLSSASTTASNLIDILPRSCDTSSPVLPVILGTVLLLAILDLYLLKPRSQKF